MKSRREIKIHHIQPVFGFLLAQCLYPHFNLHGLSRTIGISGSVCQLFFSISSQTMDYHITFNWKRQGVNLTPSTCLPSACCTIELWPFLVLGSQKAGTLSESWCTVWIIYQCSFARQNAIQFLGFFSLKYCFLEDEDYNVFTVYVIIFNYSISVNICNY